MNKKTAMKAKVGLVLLILLIFVGSLVPKAFSQEVGLSEFDRAYQEYKASIEEYQNLHETYVLKRAQYLRYKTLLSQDEAHDATVEMLKARDQVTIDYFETLRKKLEEAEGVDEVKKSELFIKMDEEVGWYNDHKSLLPSAITLNDLVKDSNKAQKRYSANIPLFYEILSHVSTGKLVRYNERLVEIFEGVESKSIEIQSEEREEYQLDERKLSLIDQWALETQARVDRSNQKLSEVDNDLLQMSDNRKAGRKQYDSVVTKLSQTRQHLKEGGAFIEEILKEIMTTD